VRLHRLTCSWMIWLLHARGGEASCELCGGSALQVHLAEAADAQLAALREDVRAGTGDALAALRGELSAPVAAASARADALAAGMAALQAASAAAAAHAGEQASGTAGPESSQHAELQRRTSAILGCSRPQVCRCQVQTCTLQRILHTVGR